VEPDEEFEQLAVAQSDELNLTLDGWEGPLDLLLSLARVQKVDLAQISILQLVEQYLTYLNEARAPLPPISDPNEPLHIDSLGLIRLVSFLESDLGVRVEDDELLADRNVEGPSLLGPSLDGNRGIAGIGSIRVFHSRFRHDSLELPFEPGETRQGSASSLIGKRPGIL